MKIGILTASRTDNNGTDLQSLAMYYMLTRLGAEDVEIIDYICEKIDTEKSIKINARNLLYWPVRVFNRYCHRNFRKQFFRKSKQVFNKSTIHTIPYDIVVVGSDQIWNLDLTGGDASFYLPFSIKGLRKYSYAASLGSARVEKWDKLYGIEELLKDFNSVSVRESSAVNALQRIGVKSHCDLDPILMGNKDDWQRFINPARKKNYILLYLVGLDPMAIKYARSLAKQRGLNIIMLNPGLKQWSGIEQLYFVSVEKWLNLMANADLIITNSYHGLSFAILFKRDFRLCLLPAESQNNNRMIDLLNNLQLTDYILRNSDETFKPIDWEHVDCILNNLIKKSEIYLNSIIKK